MGIIAAVKRFADGKFVGTEQGRLLTSLLKPVSRSDVQIAVHNSLGLKLITIDHMQADGYIRYLF